MACSGCGALPRPWTAKAVTMSISSASVHLAPETISETMRSAAVVVAPSALARATEAADEAADLIAGIVVVIAAMISVYSRIRRATSKLTLRAARHFALVLLAVVFAHAHPRIPATRYRCRRADTCGHTESLCCTFENRRGHGYDRPLRSARVSPAARYSRSPAGQNLAQFFGLKSNSSENTLSVRRRTVHPGAY